MDKIEWIISWMETFERVTEWIFEIGYGLFDIVGEWKIGR